MMATIPGMTAMPDMTEQSSIGLRILAYTRGSIFRDPTPSGQRLSGVSITSMEAGTMIS